MNRIKSIIATLVIMLGMVMVFAPTQVAALECGVGGADEDKPACKVGDGLQGAGGGQPGDGSLNKGIKTVVDVLLFVIGVISVIMIIIGGIKYTTSNGDSAAITSAKNTILYAVVGIIIAVLAYAIVGFVLGQFAP